VTLRCVLGLPLAKTTLCSQARAGPPPPVALLVDLTLFLVFINFFISF
jgi:hypothetical protein